jgi:hypothetical protein
MFIGSKRTVNRNLKKLKHKVPSAGMWADVGT